MPDFFQYDRTFFPVMYGPSGAFMLLFLMKNLAEEMESQSLYSRMSYGDV